MDVSPADFQFQLPSILDAISTARFMTIDLELSGIPGQQPNRFKASEALTKKPRLQQRYEETKAAAEKYQVLQFGITCVEEDNARGSNLFSTYPSELKLNWSRQAFTLHDRTIFSSTRFRMLDWILSASLLFKVEVFVLH